MGSFCGRGSTGRDAGGRLASPRLFGRGGGLPRGGPAPEQARLAAADRVAVVAVAGLWPGHRRWRAVIVKPGQGEPVGGFEVAGGEGVHDVTAPLSGRCLVRPGGWHWAPTDRKSVV